MLIHSLLFIVCVASSVLGKPPTEAKTRDQVGHFAEDPKRHDVNYDHEAFLGTEGVEEFAKLSPEESTKRLEDIISKIDEDKDGKITEKEMKAWIASVAENSRRRITDKRWSEINPKQIDPFPWADYIQNAYGKEDDRMKDKDSEEYKRTTTQDRRRWEAADANKDDALSKAEFHDFLHPEETRHMRDALIDEMLATVDTDKDGKVSEAEYLSDIGRAYQNPIKAGDPEPDWVAREREQFRLYRDVNHDGFMDREEVGEWIMPIGYDPVDAEAQHLFYHADSNKDNLLTKEEILAQQDLFVNSQATNYGESLEHEEL